MIIQKIDKLKEEINRKYVEDVREKLEELDDIIAKSQTVLKEEIKKLRRDGSMSLGKFFYRDLLHEVKYYDSYFNQIFIKKTRNYRTGLEDDPIMALNVKFQQNLHRIFNFNQKK